MVQRSVLCLLRRAREIEIVIATLRRFQCIQIRNKVPKIIFGTVYEHPEAWRESRGKTIRFFVSQCRAALKLPYRGNVAARAKSGTRVRPRRSNVSEHAKSSAVKNGSSSPQDMAALVVSNSTHPQPQRRLVESPKNPRFLKQPRSSGGELSHYGSARSAHWRRPL